MKFYTKNLSAPPTKRQRSSLPGDAHQLSFPLVKPTDLWNFGRLFLSGSWLTQL
jgi:hypothetical protein